MQYMFRYVRGFSAFHASNLTKLKCLFLPVSPREFYDPLFSYSYVFNNHDNIPVPCDALIIIFAAGRASLCDIVIKIQRTCRLLGDSLQTLRCLPMYSRGTATYVSTVQEVEIYIYIYIYIHCSGQHINLLYFDAGVNRNASKRGSNAQAPPSVFCQFQRRPQ